MFLSCSNKPGAEEVVPVKPEADDTELFSKSIREIVDTIFPNKNVFIGCTIDYNKIETKAGEILDREFSYVTPGLYFKQSRVHPKPGKWNWEECDGWVQHCLENNQVIRMHSPICPQCSTWAKDDNRTAEELEINMTEYMTAVCKRYNGESNVLWMDVVNETINADGSWFGPETGTDSWENPWPIIGFDESDSLQAPLYIEKAFRIANKFAPDIKQIINEHCFTKEAWEKMKKLVMYLRNKGIRVDGLGWQAHVEVGWEKITDNLEYLGEIVDWCHQNDLEFHITEFNVWLKPKNENKLNEQANTFTSIIKTVLDRNASGKIGINFWKVSAINSMKPTYNGSLYNNDFIPNPAYEAVKELLISYK